MKIRAEAIKRHAEFQINWHTAIPNLRRGRYIVDSAESLSIHGDAPKCFIRIQEYVPGQCNRKRKNWCAYIAKVGSKRYPNESITEHLLTRIGQAFEVQIADSKLLVMGGQVRFLSRYFLREGKESLIHGLEIFRRHLDDRFVEEVAESRREQEFYTFQTVEAALVDIYPDHSSAIIESVVTMLGYDAIVGNNDRHPLNWGVIVPVAQGRGIRFAPVFDTARGLFWNLDDSQLGKFVDFEESMDAYVRKSVPQIGFDGMNGLNHFALISAIYRNYPHLRGCLEKLQNEAYLTRCDRIIEEEFRETMSRIRRHAIRSCLFRRFERFRDALSQDTDL